MLAEHRKNLAAVMAAVIEHVLQRRRPHDRLRHALRVPVAACGSQRFVRLPAFELRCR